MSSLGMDTSVVNISARKADGLSTKTKRLPSTAKRVQASRSRKSKSKSAIVCGVSIEKVAIMATTLGLLAVSLFDLAKGIELLTQCEWWQAIALALGIDAMFVAVEYSTIKQGRDISTVTLTVMTLVMSAALNARAMSNSHFDLDHVNAIALGVFIPAALFLATHRLGKIK